jgi:arsenite-transporting ATPase
MEIPSFLEKRDFSLLLFGGKGGVGKTTCAAAAGFWLADRFPDASFLLVSTDPAHSLLDSLAGDRPPKNLTVLEIDARHCLESFKAKHGRKLHAIASKGTFLDDGDINRMLELSLPGLDEIMAFLEISEWVREKRYDSVLVDTAPSGHTLRLLEMPQLIEKWLNFLDSLLAKHRYLRQVFSRSGDRDDLDDFLEELKHSTAETNRILRDPALCRFVPVMIAKVLSVRETLDLIRQLKRLTLPVTDVIVNGLYPEDSCSECRAERGRQLRTIGDLLHDPAMNGHVIWGTPLYSVEMRGAPILRFFWKRIRRIGGPSFMSVSSDSSLPPLCRPVSSAPAPSPPQARLILFGGKGGVGKTTLSCATALWLARACPGKQVLLVSADPAHSLSDCLDFPVGPKPSIVAPGLTAMEIDSRAELETLKTQYALDLEQFVSRVSNHFDLPFDDQVMEEILDLAPPGLDEIMALSRVMELVVDNRFDCFVLDSAATGHMLRLLELPALIHQWLHMFFDLILKYQRILPLPGFSRRLVEFSKHLKGLRTLLADPAAARLYVVSIPTEMALEETKDLVCACKRMGIHVPAIFLNLVTPAADCGFCSALYERESRVGMKFQKSFSDVELNVIYKQAGLRGLARLSEFSEALYRPAGKESVSYAP